MDDISSTVLHNDVKFFCEELDRLGKSRGCHVHPHKTQILSSCSGSSIIPHIMEHNPQLATDLQDSILKYSTKPTLSGFNSPVELTSGFRLLGTRNTSQVRILYDKQLKEIEMAAHLITSIQIPDLHTRLKLFTQCISQKLPHLLDSDILHNHTNKFIDDKWYLELPPHTSPPATIELPRTSSTHYSIYKIAKIYPHTRASLLTCPSTEGVSVSYMPALEQFPTSSST
jgi:hypothetical protein